MFLSDMNWIDHDELDCILWKIDFYCIFCIILGKQGLLHSRIRQFGQ